MKLKITKSWIVTTSIIATLLVILFGAIIIYTITIHNSPKVGVSRFELFSDMIEISYNEKTVTIENKHELHNFAELINGIFKNSVSTVDTAESYDIVIDFHNKIKTKISIDDKKIYLFEYDSEKDIERCTGHAPITAEQIDEIINMFN